MTVIQSQDSAKKLHNSFDWSPELKFSQIEASRPPRQPARHLTILKMTVQISPSQSQKAVQMPL